MCVFNLAEWTYLEQNGPINPLKLLSCRTYYFQKLKKLSNGHSVLHARALTQMVLFERFICFFTLAQEFYLEKMSLSPP
jgi:hypothetical protein